MKTLCSPLCCFFVVVSAQLAHGQDTRFGQTYTWLTESKGQRELEVKMTKVGRDSWLSENEFEFGVSDRLTIAPYLNFEMAKQTPTVGGWALEMRYRFGDLRSKTILPAVYFEPQQMVGESAMTLEGRIIGSYYVSDNFDSLLAGNLIVSRLMKGREALSYGYALGAVKMRSKDWLGAEAYGSWTDKSHFVGPTVGMKLKDSSAIIFSLGLSLNRQDNEFKVVYARDF